MFLKLCPKCGKPPFLESALFKKNCFVVRCPTLISKWHESRKKYYQHVCNATFGKTKEEAIKNWSEQKAISGD